MSTPIPGQIDSGIAPAVEILQANGVETFESCEGGDGHAFPEPTVRFHGTPAAGPRALAVCMDHGLPVLALRRVWYMQEGEPTGPTWELVFRHMLTVKRFDVAAKAEEARHAERLRATLPQKGSSASGIETEGRNNEDWSGAEHESPTAESGDAQ